MRKSKSPLAKLAEAAFARAAEEVIAVAERTGTPLILWENGQVVEVDPREFKARKKTARNGAVRPPKKAASRARTKR